MNQHEKAENKSLRHLLRETIMTNQDLIDVLETIANEMQVAYCSGDPRSSAWFKSRISRARAAILKARGGADNS